MIAADLLAECKDLAFTIAPELQSAPLYVVDASIFAGLPCPDSCLGWASYGILPDYARRERIEGWNAPGPIIAFDEDATRTVYGADFRDGVLSTLVHELGHIVPALPPIPNKDLADAIPDTPNLRAAIHERWAIELDTKKTPPEPGTSEDAHGPRYIRRVCHLWARARFAGRRVSTEGLFGGSCWFVSQPAHYIASLLPELYSMRGASFAEIMATEPPTEFDELWGRNLEFYRSFYEAKR